MEYVFQHSCGQMVIVDSNEYPEFFDEKKAVAALKAPCPKAGCNDPIIIKVQDIGYKLLPSPAIRFKMHWEKEPASLRPLAPWTQKEDAQEAPGAPLRMHALNE